MDTLQNLIEDQKSHVGNLVKFMELDQQIAFAPITSLEDAIAKASWARDSEGFHEEETLGELVVYLKAS